MLDYLLILIPFWILAYAVYLYGVNRCEDKYVVIKCNENNEIKVYGNCDEEQNNCIEISEPEKIGNFENTESINRYLLLNGRISYRIKNLSLTLFVKNITDNYYFNNGLIDWDGTRKYFVQAPRNFYLSIKYKI